MRYNVYIDDTLIPSAHVVQWKPDAQEIAFNGDRLLAAQTDVVMDNTDKTVYDPLTSGSMFYGTDWYNDPCVITNVDSGEVLWRGRIKKVSVSDRNSTLTVRSVNYVRDMIDTTCVYSSTSNISAAEHVYEILTDLVGIDGSYINGPAYNYTRAVQEAASAYIQISLTADDNVSCLSAVEELCRMCSMRVYMDDNIIYIRQDALWTDRLGTAIDDHVLIPSTFQYWSVDSDIINSYRVYYKSGSSTVGSVTDSDAASVAAYGERMFLVPDESLDSYDDYRILFIYSTGAAWAGDLKVSLKKDLALKCKFEIDAVYDFLGLYDQLDLDFYPFYREPVRVEAISPDIDNDRYGVEARFLNLPVEIVSVDKTPPAAVEIEAAVQTGRNAITLKWTESQEADHLGYYIYFATSQGQWRNAICSAGISPLQVTGPDTTPDGMCSYELLNLAEDMTYYFRIESFDARYNRSTVSNTVSCTIYNNTQNLYRITGNIIDGLTLDVSNPRAGTVPSGFTRFTDLDEAGPYQDCAAVYESNILYNRNGWSSTVWRGTGDAGDVTFQYQESDDPTSMGSWSTAVDAVGLKSASLGGKKYLRVRWVWYSTYYFDSDTVYIKEVA